MHRTGDLQPEYDLYERQKCFVGHSHEAEWCQDILSACAEVLPEFGLEPWYAADHFDPTKPLRDKVVELIANARYGIYDLSSWRDDSGIWQLPRNVFIELGMAIALNRPALLLRHTSNHELPLPTCLQGVELLEFAGDTTLKKALKERVPQWLDVPPDQHWLSRFCIFGNRECNFREAHPRSRQLGRETLHCHLADGLNKDHPSFREAEREEIRGAFEEVLGRYSDLTFEYLDELPLIDGYQFLLCSHCQAVRSTPFAVYRILPETPAEVFIAIGMSIALETLFGYDIPKVLLVRQEEDLPSLLRGYEVVEAVNSSEVKRKLRAFIPSVMKQVRQTTWTPKALPFIDPLPTIRDGALEVSESFGQDDIIQIDDLVLNLTERYVSKGNADPQSLTPLEFRLLAALMRNRGDVLSRRFLLQEVWGTDTGNERSLEVHISWLRNKIEDDPSNPHYLHTVRGVGYWFEPRQNVYDTPIEELDLSVRACNRLKNARITQVGEILERLATGEDELLAIRGFGQKSLEELKATLEARGFISSTAGEQQEPGAEYIGERPTGVSTEEFLLRAIFGENISRPSDMNMEERSDLREEIERLLGSLSPREARVLQLRFGLGDGEPKTLEDVAEEFGVTEERIGEIETTALRRLRHPDRSSELARYLRSEHQEETEVGDSSMTKREYRTLETPSGRGVVYRDEEEIAVVNYDLHVQQEFLIERGFGDTTEEIPGLEHISGRVQVIEGERDLISGGENLTLQLQDDRSLDFFAKSGDPVTGVYEIRPTGGEGLE